MVARTAHEVPNVPDRPYLDPNQRVAFSDIDAALAFHDLYVKSSSITPSPASGGSPSLQKHKPPHLPHA